MAPRAAFLLYLAAGVLWVALNTAFHLLTCRDPDYSLQVEWRETPELFALWVPVIVISWPLWVTWSTGLMAGALAVRLWRR